MIKLLYLSISTQKKNINMFSFSFLFLKIKKYIGWKGSFLGKSSSLFWLDWWMVWDDCATNVWTRATKRLYIKWGKKIPNFRKLIGRILMESVNKCMNCSSPFKYWTWKFIALVAKHNCASEAKEYMYMCVYMVCARIRMQIFLNSPFGEIFVFGCEVTIPFFMFEDGIYIGYLMQSFFSIFAHVSTSFCF